MRQNSRGFNVNGKGVARSSATDSATCFASEAARTAANRAKAGQRAQTPRKISRILC